MAEHVLAQALSIKTISESEKKRRDRARSRKYRLQQIMIGADRGRPMEGTESKGR